MANDKDTKKLTREERRNFYNSMIWKNKRSEILERDNYECMRCKELGRLSIAQTSVLEVHHIRHLEDYRELALNNNNLTTLCRSCHNHCHDRFKNTQKKKHKISADIPERW